MSKYKDHTTGLLPADIKANDVVEVVLRNGEVITTLASNLDWTNENDDYDIVAYNVEEFEILE